MGSSLSLEPLSWPGGPRGTRGSSPPGMTNPPLTTSPMGGPAQADMIQECSQTSSLCTCVICVFVSLGAIALDTGRQEVETRDVYFLYVLSRTS